MAETTILTITPSQVLPDYGGDRYVGKAGTTITAGQAVYLDSTTGTCKLADANLSALESLEAESIGIALHASLAGQPLVVQRGGDITLGAGADPLSGVVYILSGTAGGIAPFGLFANNPNYWATIIGVGLGGGMLRLSIGPSRQLQAA